MKFSCLVTIASLLGSLYCYGQDVNWTTSRNWRLYNIHNQAGFGYSFDTLSNFASIALNDDTMQLFMSNVTKWPKDKYSLWMGLYIATCETTDNIKRKVVISSYGGFFYDELTKAYYQLPLELRNDWFYLLGANSKKMGRVIRP